MLSGEYSLRVKINGNIANKISVFQDFIAYECRRHGGLCAPGDLEY